MKSKAFTLAELIVVISVIGILATITVIGYGNWRQSVDESVIKSDLQAVTVAMENYRNFNSEYPGSYAQALSLLKLSQGVNVGPSYSNSNSYSVCLYKSLELTYCISNYDKTPHKAA